MLLVHPLSHDSEGVVPTGRDTVFEQIHECVILVAMTSKFSSVVVRKVALLIGCTNYLYLGQTEGGRADGSVLNVCQVH